MWDFFQSIVCLTNNETEWSKAQEEFARVGLSDRVKKFQALPEIGPHQSFNSSERRILIDFLLSPAETLLHLEDDCHFLSLDHLPAALGQLPEDWDIVYLGANLLNGTPERYSRNLFRVREAWTTHAVAYNKKIVRYLLENQPGFSERMFDNWLGAELGKLNAFVVNPMVAWQRPRFSTIWQRETNYDDVFSQSQDKLRTTGVHLVTYADANMSISAERCEASARQHNIELVWRWDREELERTAFYAENKSILDQPRGAGYWLWKPYIILDTITRRAAEGDIVVYADAGVEFVDNIRYALDRMDQDVFLFGNHWQHAHFCKRDVVEAVWPSNLVEARVMLDAMSIEERVQHDYESARDLATWARFSRQAQASVIAFRVSDYSRAFVNEWLNWCRAGARLGAALTFGFDNPERQENGTAWCEFRPLIDDSPSVFPNHPEFQEHRHDQAILTTLAYREGLRLHWWPAIYNGGAFSYEKGDYQDVYPVLFHHHRKRNSEWEVTRQQ